MKHCFLNDMVNYDNSEPNPISSHKSPPVVTGGLEKRKSPASG